MKPSEKIETGYLHDADKFKQEILENADLPIMVLVDANVDTDFGTVICQHVSFSRGEIFDCSQMINSEKVYSDRELFEDDLREYLANSPDTFDMSDDEFDTLVKQELAEYEPYWKPCLLLYVDN